MQVDDNSMKFSPKIGNYGNDESDITYQLEPAPHHEEVSEVLSNN